MLILVSLFSLQLAFLVVVVCLLLFWDRVLLCNSSWPGTLYINQTGLELTKTHFLLPLKMLGLKICATHLSTYASTRSIDNSFSYIFIDNNVFLVFKFLFYFCFIFIFLRGSPYSLSWPGIRFVEQAGLGLTQIYLLIPHRYWD